MTMGGRWGALLAIGGIVSASSSGARAQSCEPAAASVISVQGDVEVSGHDRAHWRDLQLNQVLCAGQQVRLMAKSRAVLKLPNETLIHLDAGSVFTLRAIEPGKPAWLDLLRGALHIISRVPRALNIHTPLVNAGIEGTEFALRVDPAQAELWVYEGRVRFSNTLGQLLIASGEAAAAAPGRPPERRIVVKPRRAVEWALYYPPLLDSRPQSYPEALRPAVLAYRRNDFTAAFAALDGVPEGARDARYHTLRAGLLLSVGRVPEAERDLTSAQRLDPKNGTAYALRSVIAVVRNEQEEALKLAAEAVRLAPGSATPYVARSYAEQSAFEIEPARKSLEKAAELAPEDALVWARLAEIELSLGDLDAALESARKAEQLDPGLSRTQSVLGFAYLTRIEVDKAKTAFERAIVLDPADPLPRLGMGLAKIRDGDLDEGTREIETAASLDPNNSLVRSYLGKAYYEQKRGGLASSEFEQAKLLDLKDPTPWFYDAIHKQTTNRPVEALHNLQTAIELNNNRAVYRSRLQLDADIAARSANLSRIYRNLGFEQRGRVEAWRSLAVDPESFSAHRFLADSYASLQRHQIARTSELLQSQLLQPANVTPIQPELAETDLAILEGSGPSDASFYELNPLFTRNTLAVQANGLIGNNGTYADDLVISGIQGPFSGSAGQFHYDTNGFQSNNELTHDIYNAFGQLSLSPDLSMQVELRHRQTTNGAVRLGWIPRDTVIARGLVESADPDFDEELSLYTARAGFSYRLTPHQRLTGSFIYQDFDHTVRDPLSPLQTTDFRIDDEFNSHQFELQHIGEAKRFKTILGFGYINELDERRTDAAIPIPSPFCEGVFSGFVEGSGLCRTPRVNLTDRSEEINGYLYVPINVSDRLTATIGASVGSFNSNAQTHTHVNPKFGLIWAATPTRTIRAAAFRVLTHPFLSNQTIEPTQVAGFNQFFDDNEGTRSTRYGVAWDERITTDLLAGIELSWRDVDWRVENVFSNSARVEKQDESMHRAYLYWSATRNLAFSADYQYEAFDRDGVGGIDDPDRLKTHYVPIAVNYYRPEGWFGKLGATFVDQRVAFEEDIGVDKQEETFWVVDAELGYRLPRRSGIVAIELRNLLDQEFVYQSFFNPAEPRMARFQPDFSIFFRVNLWYY
jgi:tetratricopeptide (TPR) repeat protein